ncbi:hypothetical protein OPT61_g3602 [Boeremia exigua]|uniref:Uncharacterized protein n=1 Tax=Boeremia exigua TaxID=749465 RepID=A0ACC2IHA9_9PLEO|nr:hypothetical protein OPT61_g3602 [Boeremia exigua]
MSSSQRKEGTLERGRQFLSRLLSPDDVPDKPDTSMRLKSRDNANVSYDKLPQQTRVRRKKRRPTTGDTSVLSDDTATEHEYTDVKRHTDTKRFSSTSISSTEATNEATRWYEQHKRRNAEDKPRKLTSQQEDALRYIYKSRTAASRPSPPGKTSRDNSNPNGRSSRHREANEEPAVRKNHKNLRHEDQSPNQKPRKLNAQAEDAIRYIYKSRAEAEAEAESRPAPVRTGISGDVRERYYSSGPQELRPEPVRRSSTRPKERLSRGMPEIVDWEAKRPTFPRDASSPAVIHIPQIPSIRRSDTMPAVAGYRRSSRFPEEDRISPGSNAGEHPKQSEKTRREKQREGTKTYYHSFGTDFGSNLGSFGSDKKADHSSDASWFDNLYNTAKSTQSLIARAEREGPWSSKRDAVPLSRRERMHPASAPSDDEVEVQPYSHDAEAIVESSSDQDHVEVSSNDHNAETLSEGVLEHTGTDISNSEGDIAPDYEDTQATLRPSTDLAQLKTSPGRELPIPSRVQLNNYEIYGWYKEHTILGPTDEDILIATNPLGHGSLGVVDEVCHKNGQFPSFVRKRVRMPVQKRKVAAYLHIAKEEARILQSLVHPHIVALVGSYEDMQQSRSPSYCLLMAPVGENDLERFLAIVDEHDISSEFSIRWRACIRNWMACLASALKYMHASGIRHQDIKPSNIIHKGDQVFFTDFSSSSTFKVGHTTSTENPARSTPMYGAPEVTSDRGRHGQTTDIFALGCVFSDMLSVVEGKTVAAFQDFLYNSGKQSATESLGARQGLSYSEKVPFMSDWFVGSRLFDKCIFRMLHAERTMRPKAAEVLQTLMANGSDNRSCACLHAEVLRMEINTSLVVAVD